MAEDVVPQPTWSAGTSHAGGERASTVGPVRMSAEEVLRMLTGATAAMRDAENAEAEKVRELVVQVVKMRKLLRRMVLTLRSAPDTLSVQNAMTRLREADLWLGIARKGARAWLLEVDQRREQERESRTSRDVSEEVSS